MKHTILFLAANPLDTDRLALDEECAAIERELRMTSGRDDFDFRSKWAVSVDELMRHLNELQPAILHFSGHGSTGAAGSSPSHGNPHRDIALPRGAGILLQEEDRSCQYVSERALAKIIASAAPSTRIVVLNACYSATVAESLCDVVGCVVGMNGKTGDAAARTFAVAFYRALGNRHSVGNAIAQAAATFAAKQLPDDLPVCKTRDAVSANQIFLANASRPDPFVAPPPTPKPVGLIDFTAERQRHDQFVGRTALLARLDQLLIADREDRWVVVTGGPGMGKSALLAAWLARREATGAVVPHHFIRRGEYDWDDSAKLVGSLVAQIGVRFPNQRESEADPRMHPAARLDAALRRVSQISLAPRGERLVVLIDGLDEYDPPPGLPARDPLAAFLPHILPRGVSLLCASRPRHPYLDMLAIRGAVQLDLDDVQSFAADNKATVRAFWRQAAPELKLDARFIDEAVARAGGNLQHAAMLRQHLAGLSPDQRRVEDIPRGLAASLASVWDRIAADPAVVDGLGILCAAREALTLDELGVVAGWTSEAQRRAFVRSAREVLVETRRADAVLEYRLHHDSIRAHVAGAIGTAALRGHHSALAQNLATWPACSGTAMRQYSLRYALTHRAAASDWTDAWRLAADMSFLEAKYRELGVHETEADVARMAESCRVSESTMASQRFSDLARALIRESYWLRTAPEATAALVWNRLRRFGWSPNDLDEQLRASVKANFLRIRHAITRESPALVRDLVGHSDSVTACAVTADGQRAVSASYDWSLMVWDLESGRALTTLKGHTGMVLACAVTTDGQRVVSASSDRTLKIWDIETGRVLVTLEGHSGGVNACAVTTDGQRVVSASSDRTLKIWDIETGRMLVTLEGHTDGVNACAVTAGGRRVVSASSDRTLKIWDIKSASVLVTLEGHVGEVTACAVTAGGWRIISASYDGTLKIWDLSSEHWHMVATLKCPTGMVTGCAVTKDGRFAVSASENGTLDVWDLTFRAPLATLEGHTGEVTACVITADGRCVVSASEDKILKVWDIARESPLATLEGHTDMVGACSITPDGRHVVSVSWDETLKAWDPEGGRSLVTLNCNGTMVKACGVTADGRRAVSVHVNGFLMVWDLEHGELLDTLECSGMVTACAVAADARRVVVASPGKTLEVWDLESRRALFMLKGHAGWITACAITADSRRLVSASEDGTLKVWDLERGCTLATLEGYTHGVRACAMTPNGRHAVFASGDRTLKVWDLEIQRELTILEGHTGEVTTCVVAHNGRHVVSASVDRTLKIWDLETYGCLLTHRGDAPYSAVATSANGIIAGDSVGGLWFLGWPW